MALGQILSQSLSRGERPLPRETRSTVALSKNLNRLISAAVVSPRFCGLLLSDPVNALATGYNGETFQLTPPEYAAVTSVHASNVRDFAAQLLAIFQNVSDIAAITQPKDIISEQPSSASVQWTETDSHTKSSRSAKHTMPTRNRYPTPPSKAKRHGA